MLINKIMGKKIQQIVIGISLAFVLGLPVGSHANNINDKEVVNILTWWGYLNHPEIIKSAEKSCRVRISFDQYYTNDEFLRRWREKKDSYEIIIFSNTIYDGIKHEIPNILDSKLWMQSKKYHPVIKQHYLEAKYSHNIAYFTHSLTGILYNPKTIDISAKDDIVTIFKKSKNKIVVIVDDAVEAKKLLNTALKNKINAHNDLFNLKNFKKIQQDSRIYIGNGLHRIYGSSNFAFSYKWSGDSIKAEKRNNLKFLIHPKLSYVSSDLLAIITDNKKSECVSNYLTREEILKTIENKDYYFSPYGNIRNIHDSYFRKTYQIFLNLLYKLEWVNSISNKEFDDTNHTWDAIKIEVMTHNNRKNNHETKKY